MQLSSYACGAALLRSPDFNFFLTNQVRELERKLEAAIKAEPGLAGALLRSECVDAITQTASVEDAVAPPPSEHATVPVDNSEERLGPSPSPFMRNSRGMETSAIGVQAGQTPVKGVSLW